MSFRPMLIDSHVNLHHERFAGDLDDVIERARAAGVDGMLTICDRLQSTDAIARITASRPFIWRSVGVHPHYAGEAEALTADALVALAAAPDVVGIGECGIDHHYDFAPRDAQERVFRAHIEAARRTGLPLIIHAREADERVGDILYEEYLNGAFAPLLHCYTGGAQLAERVYAMGGFVSFSGILTFRNAEDIRAVAASAPLDRILIETDCPYLAPVPYRGRRAEPAHVTEVARKLAEIRGLTFEEVAASTTDAFFRLFTKAQRGDVRSR